MFIRILFCLLFSFSLYAEEVTVKAAYNAPVAYQASLEVVAKHKTEKEAVFLGKLEAESEFTIEVVRGDKFPILIFTPTQKWVKAYAFGLTITFDSKELDRESKSSLIRDMQSFWGKPIKFPLTKNEEFLSKPSDEYSILPIHDKETYFEFVDYIVNLLENGQQFEKGDTFDFSEYIPFEKAHFEAVVSKIDSKEVTINFTTNFDGIDDEAKLKTVGDGKGTVIIDRDNALLQTIQGELLTSIMKDRGNDSTFFKEGSLEIELKLKINGSAKRR